MTEQWNVGSGVDHKSRDGQSDILSAIRHAFDDVILRNGLDTDGQTTGNSILWCTPSFALGTHHPAWQAFIDNDGPCGCLDVTVWVDTDSRSVEVELNGRSVVTDADETDGLEAALVLAAQLTDEALSTGPGE